MQDRPRVRHNSQPGSVTGDDADLSDVEPSETGSIGARSNATGGSRKFRTIEEREAAYNEARSRIFGLEEKEKEMSANSSTFSLSGSGSTSGGRSSMGDADDSASSAATESEWSGPGNREKRDGRRGGSVTSSSRSLRTSDHVYTAPNGSGSSRNSRATSPTITYPSLAPNNPPYDLPYGQQEPPPHGYIQYFYPYPAPPPHHGQAPGQPYVAQYPYYAPYSYPQAPPPQGHLHHSDPTSPSGNEQNYPPQPALPHSAPYPSFPWAQSPPGGHPPYPMQTSPTAMQPNPQGPHPPLQQPNPSHPQQAPYFFVPPGSYPPYSMGGYYPTPPFQPGQPMQSPTPPHIASAPPFFPSDMMHLRDGSTASLPNGTGGGHNPDSSNHSRASSRNSNGHTGTNGVGRRNAPRTRPNWNYGGGVAIGGHTYNNVSGNDTVGPRLSNRRTSSGSGSNGNKTPGDEASSTAVSHFFGFDYLFATFLFTPGPVLDSYVR